MLFKPRSILLVVLLFALFTRLYQLSYPEGYYFDEVYHAMTAKLVAANDPRAYEWTHGDTIEPDTYVEWLHPPMAKYAQASMIRAFGENATGWRMSSVLFGVGVVAMTALLAQRLFGRPWLSVLGAGIVSLDGLLLTQSRIAMNDIHLVFGLLVTLYAYVWYREQPRYWRLLLVGVCIGLTIATKWSGAFVWATVLLIEFGSLAWVYLLQFVSGKRNWLESAVSMIAQLCIRFIAIIGLPIFIYLLSYGQMFMQGKDTAYFIELHRQIFAYQFSLDATHPYQSQAWEWVFNLRPVWYFVEYLPSGMRADIYNTGNVFVYWGGAIAALLTIGYLVWSHRKVAAVWKEALTSLKSSKNAQQLALLPMKARTNHYFGLLLLSISYLLCWVPWLFSPRIMFSYHYAPAIPVMGILIAFWWMRGWKLSAVWIRFLLMLYLLLCAVFFITWYPNWVAIPLPTSFKDSLYFAFSDWR